MIFVFHGKQNHISYSDAKALYEKLQREYSTYDPIIIEADNMDAAEVANLYSYDSMFNEGQVVFIKRLYAHRQRKELSEDLANFLENKPDNKLFVIWEDLKIPSNTRYFKALKKLSKLSESKDFNKRSFKPWAEQQLLEQELSIDANALGNLMENSNYDTERFVNNLQKFKLANIKKITKADVLEYTKDTLEEDIWGLIDAINSRHSTKVASDLERLLNQGLDPIYLLIMITRNLRQITLVKAMIDQGATDRDIASNLKIPPFTVPKLKKAAQATDLKKLTALYEKLHNLDYELKMGTIEPKVGITLLCSIL